jgi:TolA-binding protein
MISTLFPLSNLLALVLFSLASFLPVNTGLAIEPKEYIDAVSIMRFADSLSSHGYHYRAIMEYERFSYYHPHHPIVPKARFNIAYSMKLAGDYISALEIFTSLAKEYEGIYPGIEAAFQRAEVLYLMNDYQSALIQYAEFISHYPQHQLTEKARSAIEEIEKQSPRRPQRTQR